MLSGLSMGWMIAGIAAIGLPMIAHLLSRRGGRTIVFPAVRFVMRAAAEHARRHRLRDVLLFVMRGAAIMLIALAFDRPVWMTDARAGGDADEGRDVVIVLDASASMARIEHGRALYDTARDRAMGVLGALDWSRDRAGVVFVRARPEAALPRLSGNREALLARVRESGVTLGRGALADALRVAAGLAPALDVAEGEGRERRIVVIGDRQRTQWEEAGVPVGAQAGFVGVGPESATANLAVTGVRASAHRAPVGREVVVTATVANFGVEARAPRVVLREAGGRELGASTPTLAPGGHATLSFATVFEGEGIRRLEVALADGSFTPDDVGRVVVEVVGARRAVMVTRARPGDMGSAAYFFEAALAPDGASAWEVARVGPDGISSAVLAGASAVVVVEAGALGEGGVEALGRYAEGGGGIVWVADSAGSARSLAALGELAGGGAYGRAGEMVDAPGPGAGIGETRFDLLGMEGLGGALEIGLRSVVVRRVNPATVGVGGVVAAWLETGGVFLAEVRMGKGRVVSAHGALDPGSSTMVKSPVFPVLVGEVAARVSEGARASGAAMVGEEALVDVARGFTGTLNDERGGVARVVGEGGGSVRLALGAAGEPGFVRVVDGAGEVVGCAAVMIDARESDMGALGDDEIGAILSGESLMGGAGRAHGAAIAGRTRPVELWGWLMASAVLLLGVEGLVASGGVGARTSGGTGGSVER